MFSKSIHISDYDYPLPDHRIAQYPVAERDQSKLLISKNGHISEGRFNQLVEYLPANSLMVFNDTKVIRARMFFQKESGALIEIFILEPISPTAEVQNAFQVTGTCQWKCLIGNAKKWKTGELWIDTQFQARPLRLIAQKGEAIGNAFSVTFSWDPADLSFSEILIATASIPLPPYMNRESELSDIERYQTVYAVNQGSVAAPTAGLHFTDKVLAQLNSKQISQAKVSLHVGAGTFKPVSKPTIDEHEMHTEQIVITKALVEELLCFIDKPIIAVGTTTTRSLESLFWFGCRLINNPLAQFKIEQWEPYQQGSKADISALESLTAVLNYINLKQLDEIHGETQIMIAPGYRFKIIKVLITNFHQPKSTLLLLVSAFYGNGWQESYQYALDHDFRFLSYGDSCLFFEKGDNLFAK
jgi:S-adenosylmethionine:tRNA ribosyltransferase-isomerase